MFTIPQRRVVFADKFQPEILTGPPSGASDKKSGGKQAISRFIRQYLENVQSIVAYALSIDTKIDDLG